MKSFAKQLIIFLVAAGAVAGLVFAFIGGRKEVAAETEREKPVKAPTRVEVVNGENVVTPDSPARASSGVACAPLETISHRPQIAAYGTVIDLGELTDLRNAVANANAQRARASAALAVARKDYERVKGLFETNQNVSEKVVQAAEGALRTEEANALAAQAALDAAHATALQRWGAVVSTWLAQDAPEFERLRLQKNLLVQITLAPSQGAVAAPPEGIIQTAGGQFVPAKFISLALRTDPKIQGRSFFYVVAADGSDLLPGMNVTALLPAGEPVPGVVVPDSAVVWLQGKAWAYAQVKPNRFARREVSTGQPVKDGWVQSKEFSHGEAFVIRGPQVLLSEEFRAQISVGEDK